jgi:uncharacterized Fe-S cluster protein YjdI
MKDITKKYDAGDITVVWQPSKCIHAAECIKALPNVYKPQEKPWISPENATSDELRDQINKCPSGALSFIEKTDMDNNKEAPQMLASIQVAPNGPLLCKGTVEVKNADGTIEIKENMTAFCRCGSSSNKPYCDGSHAKVGFKG